jgi:murein L,D-transpeptidase YafK
MSSLEGKYVFVSTDDWWKSGKVAEHVGDGFYLVEELQFLIRAKPRTKKRNRPNFQQHQQLTRSYCQKFPQRISPQIK